MERKEFERKLISAPVKEKLDMLKRCGFCPYTQDCFQIPNSKICQRLLIILNIKKEISKMIICAICEKETKEFFTFDGILLFCKECIKEGIKQGETPFTYIWKVSENNKLVKVEILNL